MCTYEQSEMSMARKLLTDYQTKMNSMKKHHLSTKSTQEQQIADLKQKLDKCEAVENFIDQSAYQVLEEL